MDKFIKIALVVVFYGLLAASSALPRIQRMLHPEARIVEGIPATPGQFPYHISIHHLSAGAYLCDGALAEVKGVQVVITTAFCVSGERPSELQVLGGHLQRGDFFGPTPQIRRVDRVIWHENFTKPINLANDIAVLLLDSPFELNENVGPIALPTQGQQTRFEVIIELGWRQYEGNSTYHLRFDLFPTVEDARCQDDYPNGVIPEGMLCTGFPVEYDQSSCFGRSGSPVSSVSRKYLAGLVSWGYCFDTRYPSVNTEVSNYINWLEQVVQNSTRDNNNTSKH